MTLDVTRRMFDPKEFYSAQISANKVVTNPEDLEKFASAFEIPLMTAKLAKLYFEELVISGVRYGSEEERRDDAIKMAKAYFEQAEDIARTASTVADKALEKLAAAAAELIQAESITGVTVSELLKIASLQLDSKIEFEAVEAVKTAGLKLSMSKIKVNDAKMAAVSFAALQPQDYYHAGDVTNPAALFPNAADTLAQKGYGYTGAEPGRMTRQMLGLNPEDPASHEHLHGILSHGFSTPGSTIETAAKTYMASAPAQGNWMSRNSKWMLPTGILGGGAAYMLYRHLKNKDDERKQQLMSMAMSRRPAGTG